MAYLKDKLEDLNKIIISWEKALDASYSEENRDASIKRYELCFELLWKVMKLYLLEIEGKAVNSPKKVFREARTSLNLTLEEVELCLEMTNDRNLATHTYSEEFAKSLYDKLPKYLKISVKIKDSIENNM